MGRMTRSTWKSLGDYFAAFEERATMGSPREADTRKEAGDASCGFCLAACIVVLGVFFSASATAATPF